MYAVHLCTNQVLFLTLEELQQTFPGVTLDPKTWTIEILEVSTVKEL